jgi:hydrogenase maturation protease
MDRKNGEKGCRHLSSSSRFWHDARMENLKPVRILGVGNVLCSDDGLGPYAIATLEALYEFPEPVEIVDAGTPGLDFTPYLADAGAVIVLDTVAGDEPPGTLRLIRDREIVAKPPPPRMTPHQPGLREALMATEFSECSPDRILLIGVVPESTGQGTRLTPAVRDAVPALVEAVIEELEGLGIRPERRDPPVEPKIWWE